MNSINKPPKGFPKMLSYVFDLDLKFGVDEKCHHQSIFPNILLTSLR